MNEDIFNMEVRKFLKRLGVTAQREIEQAVRDALESGMLGANTPISVTAHVTSPSINLSVQVTGDINLE